MGFFCADSLGIVDSQPLFLQVVLHSDIHQCWNETSWLHANTLLHSESNFASLPCWRCSKKHIDSTDINCMRATKLERHELLYAGQKNKNYGRLCQLIHQNYGLKGGAWGVKIQFERRSTQGSHAECYDASSCFSCEAKCIPLTNCWAHQRDKESSTQLRSQ